MTRPLPQRRPLFDLKAELGSLKPGKRPEAVVRPARAAGFHSTNNPVHLQALTMGSGSVDTVLVNGEIVLRGGPSTRVNELEISRAVTGSMAAQAGRLGF